MYTVRQWFRINAKLILGATVVVLFGSAAILAIDSRSADVTSATPAHGAIHNHVPVSKLKPGMVLTVDDGPVANKPVTVKIVNASRSGVYLIVLSGFDDKADKDNKVIMDGMALPVDSASWNAGTSHYLRTEKVTASDRESYTQWKNDSGMYFSADS